MIERNPFIISGYRDYKLFCDRENETHTLISNAENGVNTTLISVRRMGKTGLIHHVMARLSGTKSHICVYTDIYATQSLREFTNKLGSAILDAFPEKEPSRKEIYESLKKTSSGNDL